MFQSQNSSTRAHDVLETINNDLEQARDLFSYKDGYKSATTPEERVRVKASLEMFAERVLGSEQAISNEGFKETIIEGFKSIVERLRAIYTYIVDFYKTYMVNNVRNIERLVNKIAKDPNIKMDKSLMVEHISLLGYGYTDSLEGKSVISMRKFVSPINNIIPISIEVVRLMLDVNKTVKNQITKDKASALSGSITKIIDMINGMNCEVKPTFNEKGERISFNKVAASKKFHDTYPREESSVVLNVPGLVSSFPSFKADVEMASKNIRDFDNFIRNLDEVVKSISKSQVKSDSSYSSTEYLIQIMRLSSVAVEFQKYYMESLNQVVRFNSSIAKAIANEYLESFVSVDDQSIAGKFKGVKVHFGNEDSDGVPFISGLAVTEDDEYLDVTETVLLAEETTNLSDLVVDDSTDHDDVLSEISASIEALPMVIDQGKSTSEKVKEAVGKIIDKIVEVLKKASSWVLEKLFSVLAIVSRGTSTSMARLKHVQSVVFMTNLFKKRDIVINFGNRSTGYGVFNTKGEIIPTQIQERVRSSGYILNSVKEILDAIKGISTRKLINGESFPSGSFDPAVKEINKELSMFASSFKNTGIEVEVQEFFSKDELELPTVSIKNTNTDDEVTIKNSLLNKLSTGVGGRTGFKDINKIFKVTAECNIALKTTGMGLQLKESAGTIKNLLSDKPKEELIEISKEFSYFKTLVSRLTSLVILISKTFDYFVDSLYRVAYEVYGNKLVDASKDIASKVKFGKEEHSELEDLRVSIESALERGGFSRDEATAVNLSSRFLKDSFGIEDFSINPDLFIDPSYRKDFTQLYLNKLSNI